MEKIIFVKLLLLITGLISTISAQHLNTSYEHYLGLQTQFFQIKEAANYGLVFNGLNMAIDYDFVIKKKRTLFIYNPDVALGADFRKGIGINLRTKPVDLFYGFGYSKNQKTLSIWGLTFQQIIIGNSILNCKADICSGLHLLISGQD